MSEYDNKANEIVIGILESIGTSTDINDDINDDSYYIVEEADDNDDIYIVEEYEDANNDINNNINNDSSDTSTSTVLIHIDRCAKLKKGCRVQPKSSSLYNVHGEGTIINDSNSNSKSDIMYLIKFDKVTSDVYWHASDLMLVVNGLVITECNVNTDSINNSISYTGKWREYDSNSNSTRNDKGISNTTTPDKKCSSNSNKSNSPSKAKAPNRLYDEADRLRNKRLLAMHNSIQEFSKNATFAPKIPLSSQQLALQKEGYQNISDKLYSDTFYSKKFDRKEKLSLEQRKEATFSPKLSPRSKKLAAHKVSSTEVYSRLFNDASLKREQLLKKEEEKIQEEMKDVTFSPTISKLASKSSPGDQDADTTKRLYSYAGKHHAKRASLVESYIQEEMKDVTFTPIINYQSSPTDTGVDVATRLHEDVHRRRASLMKKRESLIADQMKEATFTPEISELSNNLAAMRSVSPKSVLSADAATSRLYEDAVRKKDRAQFLEELQAEEIRATSFTPKKYTANNSVRSKVMSPNSSKNSSPNSKNVNSPNSTPIVIRKSPPKSVNMNDFVDVNEPTEF